KKTLAEKLADIIKDEIEKGKYSIGEKLPIESKLSSMYGVGRSTVREAIKILSNIGLLSVLNGRIEFFVHFSRF
ncbi:FadR/GntR family transcriptional regulator, partial [Streptococcus pyogenes]